MMHSYIIGVLMSWLNYVVSHFILWADLYIASNGSNLARKKLGILKRVWQCFTSKKQLNQPAQVKMEKNPNVVRDTPH